MKAALVPVYFENSRDKEFDDQLETLKKLISEETHKQVYGKIEEKIEALLKKRDQGELTPEEQEYLMSYGYAPF